jgi:hypothetical protein
MQTQVELIPLEEAKRQVALVCRRLGLLHLAFAEVLVDRLGPEQGKKMVGRAIKEYSRMIGEKKREWAEERKMDLSPESFSKLSDLPSIGMHDLIEEEEVEGEKHYRAHGCVMGKVWSEYGKGDLGRLYCFVDPASSMTFNPDHKLVHIKALPDGDPYCELVMRPTTEEDRKEFASEDTDWKAIESGEETKK